MKKIFMVFIAVIVTSLNADMIRLEAGGGVWKQTPSGYIDRQDNDGALKLNGHYSSNENESNDLYIWVLLKHPIPILPNLRLEYTTISDDGKTTGSVNNLNIPLGVSAATTIDMKQYDIIPYYNILDNTFWITLDLGLDIKIVQADVNVAKVQTFPGYSSSDTIAIPLLYLRGRTEIPSTQIGLEADIKAITDGTNSVYDARVKVDYTFDISPIIQPGVEVGYRFQKVRIDDDGSTTQVDLKYKGFYAGVMLHF